MKRNEYQMPTFTVHAPLPKKGESAATPERFLFVRDGFYFWAFLLAPLWLLVHRLWLALLAYLAVTIGLGAILMLAGAPSPVRYGVAFLMALLVGFEAATLWRWTLARRKWRMLGFVVGEDVEMAERRFYAEWAKRAYAAPTSSAQEPRPQGLQPQETQPQAPQEPAPVYSAPLWRGAPAPSDVIGLFPEPRQRR